MALVAAAAVQVFGFDPPVTEELIVPHAVAPAPTLPPLIWYLR